MYVCACTACMHVRVTVCVQACIFDMYVCVCTCTCTSMYYVYTCMHGSMCMHIRTCTCTCMHACMCRCMYVCMCACVGACMYVCVRASHVYMYVSMCRFARPIPFPFISIIFGPESSREMARASFEKCNSAELHFNNKDNQLGEKIMRSAKLRRITC
jgi:hypothetical protein